MINALYIQTETQLQDWPVGINEKFIFVQIPKTGTTTVIHELTKVDMIQNIKCYRHEGLQYIQTICDIHTIPIYTIVRNPYRQMLSYFFHKIKMNELQLINDDPVNTFQNWIMSIELEKESHINQVAHIKCGNVETEKKVKLFKFEEGITKVILYLNEKHNLTMDTATHLNENPDKHKYSHIPLRSFFSKIVLEKILKEFEEQFKYLGYSTRLPLK